MNTIKFFYDLDTTGIDFRKHSIHRIAGVVEVNNEIVEEFNILSRPHPKAQLDDESLKLCKKTREEILAYQDMKEAYKEFKILLSRYIDPFSKNQRAWLVGFNNRKFDDLFLQAWFKQNGNELMGAWFWSNTLDTLVLASQYLIERRPSMPSFKLSRVAKELGVEVDMDRLYDASYRIHLTRGIYRIVTGIEVEL